jgi:hypothetical protein
MLNSDFVAEPNAPSIHLRSTTLHNFITVTHIITKEGLRKVEAAAETSSSDTSSNNSTSALTSLKPIWQAGVGNIWKDCSNNVQAELEEQFQAKCIKRGHRFITDSGFNVNFFHDLRRTQQKNLNNGAIKKLRRIESLSPPIVQ